MRGQHRVNLMSFGCCLMFGADRADLQTSCSQFWSGRDGVDRRHVGGQLVHDGEWRGQVDLQQSYGKCQHEPCIGCRQTGQCFG